MRPMTVFAFAALAALVLSGAAGAADAHGAGGHGEEKGGLSFLQLQRWDLGIFTLIVFGLLLVILQRFAWPKISEGLAKREAVILGAREEALAARRDVEEVRSKLQREYAEAQDKVRAMLDEARRDADALRATEKEAGARDAAAERERAKKEIEAARDAALEDIYKQAVDLATTLSAKTLARKITADDHRALVAESLAELKQTARNA